MNKTKQYIIKITTDDIEHNQAKKRIENLFRQLNQELEADMEIYIQTIETKKNWGNKLYAVGKGRNLHFVK